MEYISREAALKSICEYCPEIGKCADTNVHCTEYVGIKAIPAADVAPVRHGKWIPKNADGSWRVDTCSSCKKDTHYVRYSPQYCYCPNCGAKMQ